MVELNLIKSKFRRLFFIIIEQSIYLLDNDKSLIRSKFSETGVNICFVSRSGSVGTCGSH